MPLNFLYPFTFQSDFILGKKQEIVIKYAQ